MKILYDHQIFSLQKYGGVSKYFCELLKRIPRELWDTTTLFSQNEYIKSANLFKYYDIIPNHNFKGKSLLMNELNKIYSIYKITHDTYDIFHQTHFGTYCLSALKNKKLITTFHDMNHTKHAELYGQTRINNPHKIEILQKKSIEQANKVIAVSQNTKDDLINLWNIDKEKIVVIHHGIDKNKIDNLDSKRIIPNPYILFVGARDGFKNFNRFIQAFSNVSKNNSDLKLICTGFKFSAEEITKLTTLKIIDKTIQISADEKMMARLYRDAASFIYPSLYEGFGMPILEAMVYGCPVILSNSSSFPEVAGNAGIYFDPFQVDDMVEKIKLLIHSEELRKEKIILGYDQLKLFSWEKSAQEHLNVYNGLL